MTVKKIIQEELGKMFEEHGFKFTKAEPCFWPYEREKDGVHQEIIGFRIFVNNNGEIDASIAESKEYDNVVELLKELDSYVD